MINEITPKEAWEKLQNGSNTILLDVRTKMEFEFVGHPIGAVHVPLMETSDWKTDPDFVAKVKEALSNMGDDVTILALCRSGKRSEVAVEILINAGFIAVFNIVEGFEGEVDGNKHRGQTNGWRFHQLPWEQS